MTGCGIAVVVDDATSEIYYAQLVEQESTRTVLAALRAVVEKKGLFCALYSDRASHPLVFLVYFWCGLLLCVDVERDHSTGTPTHADRLQSREPDKIITDALGHCDRFEPLNYPTTLYIFREERNP